MKKLKNMFYILLPFVLVIGYAVYYISYSSNEASPEQVAAYLNNSKTIKLESFQITGDRDEQYTHFFSIASYPKVKYEIFLKTADGKCFVIGDYNHKQSPLSVGAIKRRVLNAKVNAQEYNDPSYGTAEKPIPILYFADANSPDDIFIDEAQYRKNVKEYLTYDKKVNSKK